MEVEVYADLLFLINAGMDGLCLSMTARLLHRRLRVGRWLMGSVIGGVYAVLALLWTVGAGLAPGLDILACVLMCAVTFGWREGHGGRGLLRAALLYTLLSMVMGGVMTALYSLWNRAGLADLLPDGGEGIGAWLFLLFSVAGSLASLHGGRLCRRAATVRLCEVSLTLGERTLTLRGLVDSGNLLRDPLGGRAVICLSRAAALRMLSPAWEGVLSSGGTMLEGLPDTERRRLRLIPAGSATGEGLLPGFRPDRVTLTPEGGKPREVDAVVAVMSMPLSGPEGVEGVEALVPELLI